MKYNNKDYQKFQSFILRWYTQHGRHELPWRQTNDPYKILVSELMLQQTQVDRVLPKYLAFLDKFPNIRALANASQAKVLTMWQGLGYNRRAKYLHQSAQKIAELYKGKVPLPKESLLNLPGIGSYTASAIRAFAFNQPVLLIETNVRTVYLYHFFPQQKNVHDKDILAVLKKTLSAHSPREWYYALMDYGTFLKKELPNPNRRSKHYIKQSKFDGSSRQVRGEIVRILIEHDSLNKKSLEQKISGNKKHFEQALQQLIDEKLITESNSIISLQ